MPPASYWSPQCHLPNVRDRRRMDAGALLRAAVFPVGVVQLIYIPSQPPNPAGYADVIRNLPGGTP